MLTTKFLRAHAISSTNNLWAWMFKVMFEFWGFCINGSNDLVNPGGFASGSLGYTSFPPNFPAVGLLSSGSDGTTTLGEPFFNTVSPSLSATFLNKWLVMWQSGSTSTDDSIYQITQWVNSSSVRINVFQGGTPYTGSLHPSLTTRSDINWRIVDFTQTSGVVLSNTTASFFLQFSDAGNINPGQANSQVQLRYDNSHNTYGGPVLGITLSPSGSYQNVSGTLKFTDPSSELEYSTNGGGWGGTGTGTGFITMLAAGDYFIMHWATTQTFNSVGFHIEIPQRLYPQSVDPNPIAMMEWAQQTPTQTSTTDVYATGFRMHNPPDGSTMQYVAFGRRFFGSDTNTVGNQSNGRNNGAWFNTYQNKFLFTDVVLGNATAGQYQLARARLRRVRFIAPIVPQFQRIGNNGEWLHVVNGIMWPWDNTLLSYNLFLGGT